MIYSTGSALMARYLSYFVYFIRIFTALLCVIMTVTRVSTGVHMPRQKPQSKPKSVYQPAYDSVLYDLVRDLQAFDKLADEYKQAVDRIPLERWCSLTDKCISAIMHGTVPIDELSLLHSVRTHKRQPISHNLTGVTHYAFNA